MTRRSFWAWAGAALASLFGFRNRASAETLRLDPDLCTVLRVEAGKIEQIQPRDTKKGDEPADSPYRFHCRNRLA